MAEYFMPFHSEFSWKKKKNPQTQQNSKYREKKKKKDQSKWISPLCLRISDF